MAADPLSPPCVHRGGMMLSRRGIPIYRCVSRTQCTLAECEVCPQRRPLPVANPNRPRVTRDCNGPPGQPTRTDWTCPHRSAEPVGERPYETCGCAGKMEPVFRCGLHACDCTINRYLPRRIPQPERVCTSCPDLPDAIDTQKANNLQELKVKPQGAGSGRLAESGQSCGIRVRNKRNPCQ
jgi:hypothetical protein